MAGSADRAMDAYLACVRSTLDAALCIRNFASEDVERHNTPLVETHSSDLESPLLLKPILITKTERDRVMVEVSVNSVRISIGVKQNDEVERMIASKFMRFMMRRAEEFGVLRKVAVEGYDISLLITHKHMEKFIKSKIVDFVCEFISNMYADIMEIKLQLNQRGRKVADLYLQSFSVAQ